MNNLGLDGFLDTVDTNDLAEGMVLRMMQSDPDIIAAFSDCVILSIDRKREVVELGRCYCYASPTGQPLLGCEQFPVSLQSLRHNFKIVLLSTGSPVIFSA